MQHGRGPDPPSSTPTCRCRRTPIPGDAGADLVTTVDVALAPGERAMVPTGLSIALPGRLRRRSSTRAPDWRRGCGVSIVNTPGHGRRRLPRRDQGPARQPRPARSRSSPVARRPDRPARVPAGRAGPFRRGRPAAGFGPRRRRVRFDRRVRRRRVDNQEEPVVIFRRKADKDEQPRARRRTSRHRRRSRATSSTSSSTRRPNGPWDRAETDGRRGRRRLHRPRRPGRQGRPGLELRLQVDEQAQQVAAVMLAGPESGLELRAFAAPRSGRHLGRGPQRHRGRGDQARRHGDRARRRVRHRAAGRRAGPDAGRQAGHPDQPDRRRRGAALAAARHVPRQERARSPIPEGLVEQAFRDVIVVRGDGPMAPRDMIPMPMPARREPRGRSIDQATTTPRTSATPRRADETGAGPGWCRRRTLEA